MNHFFSLVILALGVAAVFALVTKEDAKQQLRYFFVLLGYLVLGALVTSWVMYSIPW
jgi:mannose/fructose/N-acetylgalactosamine-specific phosphotransferase system component IID